MELIILPPSESIFILIGNFPIRYYGLIMAFSFLVGILFAYFLLKKKYSKIEASKFFDYSPWIILFSIIGARLFYVIGSFEFYLCNPLEIIMINHGGLSIFGAIFAGIISILFASRIYKFNFLSHLDIISVTFPLCQAIGRFGNYFNQEAYGLPSNGFLKLYVDERFRIAKYSNFEYFHPAFLYEIIFDLIIFLILNFFLFKKKNIINGQLACLYLILYSIIRFFMEFIRIDSVINIGAFSIVQIICVFTLFSSILSLFLIKKYTQ